MQAAWLVTIELWIKKGSPSMIGIQRPGAIRVFTDFEVQMASNEERESFMYLYNLEQTSVHCSMQNL